MLTFVADDFGKAWLDVTRAWVQANKIEQGRVEKGVGLTSFPGFFFFPPNGAGEEQDEERS